MALTHVYIEPLLVAQESGVRQECKSTLTRACGRRAGPWPSL